MRRASIAAAIGLLVSTSSSYAQEALSAGHREAGAIVFKKCMACHQVGEGARNGIGPVLNGVVGRPGRHLSWVQLFRSNQKRRSCLGWTNSRPLSASSTQPDSWH